MQEKRRRQLLAAVCVLVFGGCVSYEEQARQNAIREQQYQARLEGTCQGFGFARGTPEFSQCMLQLHQAEEQRRAAIGAALIGSGFLTPKPQAPITVPYQPVTPPYQQPRQTNCYTDRLGFTQCTTY
jgi:hypothetical protein